MQAELKALTTASDKAKADLKKKVCVGEGGD